MDVGGTLGGREREDYCKIKRCFCTTSRLIIGPHRAGVEDSLKLELRELARVNDGGGKRVEQGVIG
jgi:hypothetical protein